jgi:hypothetical protein
MDQVIEDGRVQNRGSIKLLPRDCRPDGGENSRADDGADAERGQRPRTERFLEPVCRLF